MAELITNPTYFHRDGVDYAVFAWTLAEVELIEAAVAFAAQQLWDGPVSGIADVHGALSNAIFQLGDRESKPPEEESHGTDTERL